MKKEIIATVVVFACASSLMAGLTPVQVARMDVDKDQKISQAEYVTSMSASFASKDKDKDGFLTNAEHTHASFKAFDKNKDGKITKEEYSALFMKQFKNTHDKNKDGFVTSDEM